MLDSLIWKLATLLIFPQKAHSLKRNLNDTNKVFLPYIKRGHGPHGETFEKSTTYKQYSSPPRKYNKCYGQQRTTGTPSPLQEYTGYVVVVARYILEPQYTAFTPKSKNIRDTAD